MLKKTLQHYTRAKRCNLASLGGYRPRNDRQSRAVSLFVQLFSYGTFRTNFSYRYFSYNYFRTVLFVQVLFVQVLFVQIQGGGGKSSRVRGGISSHKLLLRRGLFAPLASNFAPSFRICTKSTCTKSPYEK